MQVFWRQYEQDNTPYGVSGIVRFTVFAGAYGILAAIAAASLSASKEMFWKLMAALDTLAALVCLTAGTVGRMKAFTGVPNPDGVTGPSCSTR